MEHGCECGGVWNGMRVEVCEMWLIVVWKAWGKCLHHFEIVVMGVP